ncbi:class I SAM-dependent methyltransferase [Pelagibius sp. Alg239-R121]|uniref:class I SAM-dependent methyltransferase n=1 Tax=Pelagibius sp. Alg239-R121 TaxID=2993448 RepID=UPI0024A77915|nr:class I SAM-dependent methyltransferase [Pelagibius sp. Alg239-R121]
MCFSCVPSYERFVAPHVVHVGCSLGTFSKMRMQVVPQASGVVAEIGFGSGLNLPYYDMSRIERLIAIDPDEKMLSIARRKLARKQLSAQRLRTELMSVGGECIPLDRASVDTAVVTYAFCTIPEPDRALREIRRVLRPGGRLLFCEHGRSGRPFCRRMQDRLNGVWGHIAGGCNLNRSPQQMIEEAGFAVCNLRRDRFPLHLWPLGDHFAGHAVPK